MYDPYLYSAITRDNVAGGAMQYFFSVIRANFGAPELGVQKDLRNSNCIFWKKEVIKIKLSEWNFLTLTFSGRVTSTDVTIYI